MSLQLFHRRYHRIDENPGHGLISGVKDSGDNFSPVTKTPAIIDRRCLSLTRVSSFSPVLTPARHEVANISANFRKIRKWPQRDILRSPGELIPEKNLNTKISCQTPFKNLKSKDDVSYFFL
jgi:hypothetical protein